MRDDWTADVVGRMHRINITGMQLAERAGYTNAYLSTVLSGHGSRGNEETKARIISALEALEAEAAGGAEHDPGG